MVKKTKASKQRIAPREAAIAANSYYNEVTGQSQQATVEEIELNESDERWRVTLGFVALGIMPFGPKIYKIFEIDAYTGKFISMKIREI